MKTQKIQFGTVLWFDETKNQGAIRSGERIEFSLDSQRVVVAGFKEPEFGLEAPKLSSIPQEEQHVVLTFQVGYKLSIEPGRRILRRTAVALAWNYALAYQAAKREIAARPVYEVIKFTLYRGEPVSEKPRRVIAVGTAVELQAKYPRGARNDPFVSEKHSLDITVRCRFQMKGKEGQWCDDPRPLPKGAIAEKVLPVNGHGVILADDKELLALAAQAGGRRNGTTTSKPADLVAA
ncbi:MAG: hypothetical protein HYV67_04140 [Candidatus Taylorbacteria bacterium]|nr:hypothetical protein [Candidatus Taylorbacteria bacterium]